jgi:hypothetical protein
MTPGEGVVEEEAGQDEEERDADLSPGDQAAEDAGECAALLVPNMAHQHQQRSGPPDAVESGEAVAGVPV